MTAFKLLRAIAKQSGLLYEAEVIYKIERESQTMRNMKIGWSYFARFSQ